jgi:hypothetical protein
MPRSQNRTAGAPAARQYSPAESHSSIVAAMPRFTRTGRPERPAAWSSAPLCMFRDPIWIRSAVPATASTEPSESASVTTSRRCASAASRSQRSASSPTPWKS